MAQRTITSCNLDLPGGWRSIRNIQRPGLPSAYNQEGMLRRQIPSVPVVVHATHFSEVEFFTGEYFPEAREVRAQHILYKPGQILATSDLLKGKMCENRTAHSSDILVTKSPLTQGVAEEVREIELFIDGFVPQPEQAHGENIRVTAADLLANEISNLQEKKPAE